MLYNLNILQNRSFQCTSLSLLLLLLSREVVISDCPLIIVSGNVSIPIELSLVIYH